MCETLNWNLPWVLKENNRDEMHVDEGLQPSETPVSVADCDINSKPERRPVLNNGTYKDVGVIIIIMMKVESKIKYFVFYYV